MQKLALPFLPMLLLNWAQPQAKESVLFFGLAPGDDPLLASYFTEQVLRSLSSDSILEAIPSDRWASWAQESPRSPKSWTLEDYRSVSKKSGAKYFVLAFEQAFQYTGSRIWWKPWALSVRFFYPVRIQVFSADKDSTLYDGVVAFKDSVKSITPWPYQPVSHSDPVAYDAWKRLSYANLANPTVLGIRSAILGKPMVSEVFVIEPPKKEKAKKAKK